MESTSYLVIDPSREQTLYPRLTRIFMGHEDVTVIVDRRRGQRRHTQERFSGNRRQGEERRVKDPWMIPSPPVALSRRVALTNPH